MTDEPKAIIARRRFAALDQIDLMLEPTIAGGDGAAHLCESLRGAWHAVAALRALQKAAEASRPRGAALLAPGAQQMGDSKRDARSARTPFECQSRPASSSATCGIVFRRLHKIASQDRLGGWTEAAASTSTVSWRVGTKQATRQYLRWCKSSHRVRYDAFVSASRRVR